MFSSFSSSCAVCGRATLSYTWERPGKRGWSQEETFRLLLSCSLVLNMWGQKFMWGQVLSSRTHSAPISWETASLLAAVCLGKWCYYDTVFGGGRWKMNLLSGRSAQLEIQEKSRLYSLQLSDSDMSFINIIHVFSPKNCNCRFLSLRVSSSKSVASAPLQMGCTWLLGMKMEQSVSSTS